MALAVFLLATVSSVAVGFYLASGHSSAEPSFTTPHFLGGVNVIFKRDVSGARMHEVATSVKGIVIFRDQRLKQIVLGFNPPVNLEQAEEIAKGLRAMPDIESAGPEFEMPTN